MVYNIHDMFRVVRICKNIAVIIFEFVARKNEREKKKQKKHIFTFFIWFLSSDQ